jgi:hypothetical protein
MKKFLIALAMIPNLVFGKTSPEVIVIPVIPQSIPFSAAAVPMALAAASILTVQVSSEKTVVSSNSYDLPLLHSKKDLQVAVDSVSISYTVSNPFRAIELNVVVLDSTGNPVLQAFNQFNLIQMNKKWVVPDNAGQLWFTVTDRKIPVGGAASAQVEDRKGNIQWLDVTGGFITVPGSIANNPMWDTLAVTFQDGSVVKYNGASGNRIYPAKVANTFGDVTINNLIQGEIKDGTLYVDAYPQYGWNPVVELKQTIVLDAAIRQWSEFAQTNYTVARPTKVFITTLNDIRAGKAPISYEYSPEGYDNGTISVPLGVNTYYLWFSWTPNWTNGSEPGKG